MQRCQLSVRRRIHAEEPRLQVLRARLHIVAPAFFRRLAAALDWASGADFAAEIKMFSVKEIFMDELLLCHRFSAMFSDSPLAFIELQYMFQFSLFIF